jgi:hypothetical protein
MLPMNIRMLLLRKRNRKLVQINDALASKLPGSRYTRCKDRRPRADSKDYEILCVFGEDANGDTAINERRWLVGGANKSGRTLFDSIFTGIDKLDC